MAQSNTQGQGNTFQRGIQTVRDGFENFFKKPEEIQGFQGQGQQQQSFQQQQQSNNQQQQQQPSGATNRGATNDPESLQNPLDVYADLWSNKPQLDKDGKPIEAPQAP